MILALDISTKTGYAVLAPDSTLVTRGTYHVAKSDIVPPDLIEEYQFISQAETLAQFAFNMANEYKVDKIVIEQTNQGRNRTTQKQLEFLHYAVLHELFIRGLGKKVMYVNTSEWRSGLEIRYSKDQRKHNKLVKAKAVRGKVTMKHLAVRWVNEKYGLNLLLKDNDQADAICLALYAIKKMAISAPSIDLDAALT